MGVYTRFLNLFKPTPGVDDWTTDDYAFIDSNMDKIDGAVHLAMQHRHDGAAVAGDDAPVPPTVALAAADGDLSGDTPIYYRITKVGASGIETAASTVVDITTPASLEQPGSPEVTLGVSGGSLPPGLYLYAITAWRGFFTRDTMAGVAAAANLPPSAGGNQTVTLTLPELPDGADGLNVYRRVPGSTTFNLLASIDADDVDDPFLDDGSVIADAERVLPAIDNSGGTNAVEIELPAGLIAGEKWVLYRSYEDDQWVNTKLAEVAFGEDHTVIDSGGVTFDGTPPTTSLDLTNPGPVDLFPETTGILPVERHINTYIYNSSLPDRTATHFNDWQELMAAVALVPGPKSILFEQDETIGTTGMPTAGWDLNSATLIGPTGVPPQIVVTFDEGAKLDPTGLGPETFAGTIHLYNGSSEPVVNLTEPGAVILGGQAGNLLAGTAPFILVDDPGAIFIMALRDRASFNLVSTFNSGGGSLPAGDHPVLQVDDAAFALVLCWTGAGPENGTISGSGTISLNFSSATPGSGMTTATPSHPDVTGTLNVEYGAIADWVMLLDAVSGNWPEGVPASVADALHKLAARGSGTAERTGGVAVEAAPRTRTFDDGGTTDTSTTLTSDSPRFTPADVGAAVEGAGGEIPGGTTILSFTSTTEVEMSAAATATNAAAEITVTPVLPTIDIATAHADTPAASYGAVLGTGSDAVEILLPDPATSPAIFMLASTGDGGLMSTAPTFSFFALGSEFAIVFGDIDTSISGAGFLAVPVTAGPDVYGWAITNITQEDDTGGDGADLAGFDMVANVSDVYDLATPVAAGVGHLGVHFADTDPVEIQLPIASATEGQSFHLALAYEATPSAIDWTMDGDTITPIILGAVDSGSVLGETYKINIFTATPYSTDDGATYTWLLAPLGSPVSDIFHGARIVKPTADLDVGTFTDLDLTDPDGTSTLATVARSGRVGMIALVVDTASSLLGFWIITASGPCTFLGQSPKGMLVVLNSVSDAFRPWVVTRKVEENGSTTAGYPWVNP